MGLVDLSEKDIEKERQLSELNDFLEPLEKKLRDEAQPPVRPVCFIIGPPRSGTTVLTQLLAATGLFQTTTNFVAGFWKAPALAIRMSKAASLPSSPLDFESERGRTVGVSAPHEFGYFWSSWFDLGQAFHTLDAVHRARVDLDGLSRAVGAMEAASTRPLLFKNNTWCTYQADMLAVLFPTARFVVCERDRFFVAQSILEQRRKLGDENQWWSVKPLGSDKWAGLTPLQQVALQTTGIYKDMANALAGVPSDRICPIDYQRLCTNPRHTVEFILTWFGLGAAYEHTNNLPDYLVAADAVRLDPLCSGKLVKLLAEYSTET